jgi:hypothetical protein
MARKQERTISPRFIMFCASVFILVIAVVILIFAVGLRDSTPKKGGSGCGRSQDALSFAAEIDTGTVGATARPQQSEPDEPSEASVIPVSDWDSSAALCI